jgi:hypothetical protein
MAGEGAAAAAAAAAVGGGDVEEVELGGSQYACGMGVDAEGGLMAVAFSTLEGDVWSGEVGVFGARDGAAEGARVALPWGASCCAFVGGAVAVGGDAGDICVRGEEGCGCGEGGEGGGGECLGRDLGGGRGSGVMRRW